MKRILLINALSPSGDKEFNLGLGYIAASLKKSNIQVRVLCDDLYAYEDIALIRAIKEGGEKIVGISSMYASFLRVIHFVQLIKSYNPDIKVILGGFLPSASPEFVLNKSHADFACIGPGEETIVKIVEAIYDNQIYDSIPNIAYRDGAVVTITKKEQLCLETLKDIDWPLWEAFPIERYLLSPTYYPFESKDRVFNIITARGCPYSCNFCYNPSPYFQRDLDDVLNEMEYLIKHYKVNGFYIEDDLLMVSKDRILSFCNKITQRGIKIKYTITGRFNIIDEDILYALKQTGCITIFYGAESGNQKILDNMNKKITLEQIYRGVELTRKNDIFCRMGFMFGQPHETRETLKDTISLIKNLAYGCYEERYLYGCIPFPGSALFDFCIKNGLLKDDNDFFNRFNFNGRILSQLPVNMTDIKDDVNLLLYQANEQLRIFYAKQRSHGWYEKIL